MCFPGIEGESLLCTETLPSSTPPADDAQLPAQASTPHHLHHALPDHSWTQAHLPAAKDVQFALIVPETFLASNQHLLARATLLGSAGEDVGGAAGAVVTVQAADIGVAGVRQDESVARRILAAPTLLREVVSLTPGSTLHGGAAVNGFDVGGQKAVSSSAVSVPAVGSGGGDSGQQQLHLVGLAEVAVQQVQVLSPSPPSSGGLHAQLHPQPHPHQRSSPAALSALPASEGMHSGRPGTGSGHSQGHTPTSSSQDQQQQQPHPHSHPHAMLSAGASAGPSAALGVFRGSLTHGEPVSRVLGLGSGAGQYTGGAGGNSASSPSLGPYSALYSVHGQAAPLTAMSPYPGGGFFTQYPAAAPHYSPASLVASARFPHIESYSAVLASMGSHVQHGGHASPQGQAGARAPYLQPAMGQYSHRSLSSGGSPGPATHSPSGPGASFSLREREALQQQQQQSRERERSPPHHGPGLSSDSPPDDKGLLHSPGLHYPHRGSPGGLLKDAVKGDPRDPFHKVPSGKEGSLKHRILTRPPEMAMEAAYGHAKGRSQSVKGEEEVPGKRTKYMTSSMGAPVCVSSSPTDPHVFLAPHALGPGPPSAGHYAHHSAANSSATLSPSSSSSSSATASSSHAARTPESGASPGSEGPSLPPHLHYPPHFIKGSIIQLANGDLKRVEDLQTEDFVSSAQVSADLKVDSSTVVRIEEHPEVGTATLGFSVGEHRVQVGTAAIREIMGFWVGFFRQAHHCGAFIQIAFIRSVQYIHSHIHSV